MCLLFTHLISYKFQSLRITAKQQNGESRFYRSLAQTRACAPSHDMYLNYMVGSHSYLARYCEMKVASPSASGKM